MPKGGSSFGTGLIFTEATVTSVIIHPLQSAYNIYTCSKFLLSALNLNFASRTSIQYHLNNLKIMSVPFSRKITFTARYVARWYTTGSVSNLCITYASQRRHRLAYSSASSSLQFLHIECQSSAFSSRTASCGLEVRSVISHCIFPETQRCTQPMSGL